MNDARRIVGEGTPERAWQQWPALAALPPVRMADLLPAHARLVVVAPHPDDEVLACGGLMLGHAAAGRTVRVVAVTDGEASHPAAGTDRSALAARRAGERALALQQLGVDAAATGGADGGGVLRLSLPDGHVGRHAQTLQQALRRLLRPGDVLVCTWALDGHPDHEAVGAACRAASAAVGCRLLEAPVWMWHWAAPGDAAVPWQRLHRLALDAPTLASKRRAVMAYASQLAPRDDGEAAVLPAWALDRLLRPAEYFFF